MPIPTREEIKAYFETGDTPTETQFAAFIDAAYDLAQSAQDTADAAVATANATLAQSVKMSGAVLLDFPDPAILKENACSIAAVYSGVHVTGSVKYTVTVTFDDALADDDYVFVWSLKRSGAVPGTITVPSNVVGPRVYYTTKSTTELEFIVVMLTAELNANDFDFAII